MKALGRFRERVSTRLRTAVAVLSCMGMMIGVLAFTPPATKAEGSRYTLTVRNRSSYRLDRLYLSSTELETWGRDVLGQAVIPVNGDFTVQNIKAGEYDVKVVDEDGDSCVIRRVNIFENKQWTLTDQNLLRCQGY